MTPIPTLESIHSYLCIADDWEKKGKHVRFSQSFSSALLDYLCIAVNTMDDPAASVAWLRQQGMGKMLARYWEAVQVTSREVDAKRLPGSVLVQSYDVFAHLSWCLGDYAVGEKFVTILGHSEVVALSTQFWCEYGRGMRALVCGESYIPVELKLSGLEKHWMTYLKLIEAVCANQPLDPAMGEIDRMFHARNADKRIKQDRFQIEGNGEDPVRWDYRREGLVNYIKHRAST